MYALKLLAEGEHLAEQVGLSFSSDAEAGYEAVDLAIELTRRAAKLGDDFFTGKQKVIVFFELVNCETKSAVDFGEVFVRFRNIAHWDTVEEFLRRCRVKDLDLVMEDYADFMQGRYKVCKDMASEAALERWAKMFVMQQVIGLEDSVSSRAEIALDVQDMFVLVSQGLHS